LIKSRLRSGHGRADSQLDTRFRHRRGNLPGSRKIDDATAVNLGTMERIRVIDVAREILRYTGKEHLRVEQRLDMPVGPLNRVADNRLAT
jgi:hypothetical protein